MTLREFLDGRRKEETIKHFCRRNGLNEISVILVANGHRKAGPALAKRLCEASGGLVPLAELRPDLWG